MYSKRFGIHSTTLRSRVCARHPGVDGCAPDRQGNPCGLRLGRAHRQHRGAVAGAGQSHGFGQRLSDREPRGQQEATAAGCRARLSRTTFLLIVESGLRLQPRSAERRRRPVCQAGHILAAILCGPPRIPSQSDGSEPAAFYHRLHQRPSRRSGWKSITAWFIYLELDKTIPAALQAFTAPRGGSKETLEVPGASHMLMLATGSCISTGGARHQRDSAHWRRVKSPNT